MFKSFLMVGIGGAAGSMARFGVSYLFSKLTSSPFPFATFAINITGCLLIGILYGLADRNSWVQGYGGLLLMSGFCGGFTTFSTFALENITLAGKQLTVTALIYTALSLVAGLLLCRLGIWLAR